MLMKSDFVYQKNPTPHKTLNGNGHASPKVERGASLAQRKLTKSQRAALAANVFDGRTTYQPTRRELSGIFGVSGGYIDRARQLPPEKRQVVIEGRASLSRFNSSARRPLRPKPHNGATTVDDATLTAMVRVAGIERVLSIASAVEREQITHQ
jgi:hypothetical protein